MIIIILIILIIIIIIIIMNIYNAPVSVKERHPWRSDTTVEQNN